MISIGKFPDEPKDHEDEKASNSSVMSLADLVAGFPIVNLLTTFIFFLANKTERVKLLSSSAYDRKLEKEAGLDAEPFASFLFRLNSIDRECKKYLVWINTHPNSENRAKYILENRDSTLVGI